MQKVSDIIGSIVGWIVLGVSLVFIFFGFAFMASMWFRSLI